jgi:hypothetical protein
MKKSIVILLVIISIFAASCSPQVTVTSQVTVTLPTATQPPDPSATPTAVYTPTPAKDIITNPGGIGFELGAQVEGQPEGVRQVVDIVLPEVMDAKKQADFEIKINPMTYGFGEGETQLVYVPDGDKFRVELQRTSNPADVIAVFGDEDFVWNPEKLVHDNGDPVFLDAGLVVAVRYRAPANREAASSAAFAITGGFNKLFNRNGQHFPRHQLFIFISRDGQSGVQVNYTTNESLPEGEGYLYFRDKDQKTVRYIHVKDFDERTSFVEALH